MFPLITNERFEQFYLNELFDYNKYIVKKFFETCKTARDVADKVIRDIQYPFHMGQPDDQHHWNHFHGKFDRTITDDYWQTCSETALIGWGDCEDSSILTVGGMRLLGIADVYEVFGLVRDAADNSILGGHGWVYARDASFQTDKYVLVESTLDVPPSTYPEVGSTLDDLKKPFAWNGIIYEPQQLFNDVVYIEMIPLTMRKKREKESLRKYMAIERAWGVQTKFMKMHRKSKLIKLKRVFKLT